MFKFLNKEFTSISSLESFLEKDVNDLINNQNWDLFKLEIYSPEYDSQVGFVSSANPPKYQRLYKHVVHVVLKKIKIIPS